MIRDEIDEVKRSAWLVSHGQEHIALGGPTTRLRQIEQTARANGHNVSATANAHDLLNRKTSVSVSHVFNSWALQSAITTLALARRTRRPVVFSPIMLNLADRAYYDEGVKSMLARATSANDVKDGAALIHDMTPAWDRDTSCAPRQGVSSHFEFIRRQTALADKIICLSAYERDLLASIGVSTEATSIIPNGVDTEVMRDADPDFFFETYGITDFVLLVGRIEPRKNQALSAFALRDLGCPIVCIGHIGDQDYFEQVKKWGGPNFVHIDRISDRELLASAYKAASVLLLASWSEGAPLVALEAAAAGTPLVLSTMSSEQDYFQNHASYVHPADLDGIRSAVEPLLARPGSEPSRTARSQFAQERFGIDAHVDRTLALYEEAIDHHTPPPKQVRDVAPHLDVTHLTHQIHNRKPLTGVPVVEKELGGAMISLEPRISVTAWSSRSSLFESIPTTTFATTIMGDFAEKPILESENFDTFCERVEMSYLAPRFSFFGLLPQRGPGPRRRILTLFKHAINALPGAPRQAALKLVRTRKPDFSGEIAPEHYLLESARVRHSSGQVSGNRAGQFHLRAFERPQSVPRRHRLEKGGRLFVLGHAWISNDRYLDDLIEMVARDDVSLAVHVPDILYVTRPGTFGPAETANFTRRLKTVLSIADTIITISSQSAADIRAFAQECGYQPETLQITLGVPPLTPSNKPPSTLTQGEAKQVLYVASMSERKRHDFLIEAWINARDMSPHVRDARLVLVGQPLPAYERFRESAFHKKLAKHGITIINECDADHLVQLYHNCAFTVYPSAAEGWGLPPVESLSVGKPCLVSDTLPVAQDIDSSGLKRVPTLSLDAWVSALCEWLDSPEALEKAMNEAAAFVTPTWQDAAKKVLND